MSFISENKNQLFIFRILIRRKTIKVILLAEEAFIAGMIIHIFIYFFKGLNELLRN